MWKLCFDLTPTKNWVCATSKQKKFYKPSSFFDNALAQKRICRIFKENKSSLQQSFSFEITFRIQKGLSSPRKVSKRILRKLVLAAQGVLKKALVKAMRLPWGGEENSGQTKIFANGAEFLFILFLMVRILLLYFKILNTIVWVKSGGFFCILFTSVYFCGS